MTTNKNQSRPSFHGSDIEQIEKYFPQESARRTGVTFYTKSKGIEYNAYNGTIYWLTRTMGKNKQRVAYIGTDGKCDYKGCVVNDKYYGIRPAFWIDMDKFK